MKFRHKILLFYIFFSNLLFSQKFTGVVIDEKTDEKLVFVNIIYNSNNQGTTSDLNGYFTIENKTKIEFLKFSCLGYNTIIIPKEDIINKNFITVKMTEDKMVLAEVEILPGINPAHRIIDLVIENSSKNNPENIKTFTYTSYNKMYFTVDIAKITKKEIKDTTKNNNEIEISDTTENIDTIKQPQITKVDLEEKKDSIESSSDTTKKRQNQRAINFFNSQHIFLSESITERKYKYPKNNKETIVAQRMSGMKNPAFLLLASQFQSMSFYSDYIEIMNKKYLSPVSKNSTRQYLFILEDTIFNEKNDTIFVISYRPMRSKNFDGLKGVIHVNTNAYAIQNVTAKPYEKHPFFDVNIQQKFEFINDTLWFPVQLNTDLILNILQLGIDSTYMPVVGIGKTYISDIQFDTILSRRNFNQIEIEVKNDASKKSEDFWNKYRVEPLNDKDLKTYRVIDSIGKEAHLDQFMDVMEIMISGAIPIKFININLNSIYWYDDYQGHRLGLGLSTNKRLSRYFSINGYFAYSFRDKAWKYGGGAKFYPFPFNNSNLEFEFNYYKDLFICDNFNFYSANKLALTNSIIGMFQNEMDSVTVFSTAVSFTSLKYLNTNIKYSYIDKNIINKKRYDYIGDIFETFKTHELGLYFRYAYKEKFMETPNGNRLSLGTKYPIIHFNIISGILPQYKNYDYIKLETAISKTFTIRNFGETSIFATGSYLIGDAPYSNLYMITGVNSWLNFNNVFNTMGVNEFVTDRYTSIFLYHNFKSLLFKTKKFTPEIVLVSAAGWGDARLAQNNENKDYAKLMDKGYFESGIQLNYLLNYKKFIGFGAAVYYRYGPYRFVNKEIKNWAFKLNLSIGFQ